MKILYEILTGNYKTGDLDLHRRVGVLMVSYVNNIS